MRDQRGADERQQWQGVPASLWRELMLHWLSTVPLSLEGTRRDTPGHVCGTCLSLHNQNHGSPALDAACLSVWLWAEYSERLEVLQSHWGEGGCLGCGEIKLTASGLPSGAPASPMQTWPERWDIPAITGRGESGEQWRNMCG